MSKKRIKGLCMMLIGLAYMFSLFVFIDTFEKMNETLCFILTIISVLLILFGLIFILTKSHEELLTEEKIKREEHIKLSKYYKYKPYLTYTFVGINILFFIIVNLFQGDDAVLNFAISKEHFAFYRIFTSMFVHGSEAHLFFNMFALLICGSKLESLIGNIKYFGVYMLSGLCSSILIAFMESIPCVGASGAIFGLFGCYLMLAYKNRDIMRYTYKYDLLPTVILDLIISFLMPNISITAHLGGFIIGLILYFVFCRKIVLK